MSKQGVKKHSPQAKNYAKQKENDKMLWTMRVLAYTSQEMLDAVALTLHEFYGFGPERQKLFHDQFEKKYDELRKLEREDAEDNEYYIAAVERALQAACGKYYQPREVRYDIKLQDGEGNVWKL